MGSTPSVPTAPNYAQQYAQGIQAQLQYTPQLLQAEQDARNLYNPQRVKSQQDLQSQFGGQQQANDLAILQGFDPQGTTIRKQLGDKVSAGLDAGYSLGPDLTNQLEQGIRSGQAARGNSLGNSSISAESLFKGQNAVNLYNQRLAQAGTYLSTPLAGQSLLGAGQVTPDMSSAYVNPSAGTQGVNFGLQNYQNQLAQYNAQNSAGNPWASALGGAAGGAAAGSSFGPYGTAIGAVGGGILGYFSDENLKHDVSEVYRTRAGLPIKTFRYNFNPKQEYVGVMAQDVERFSPESVGEIDGIKIVSPEFEPIPI